MLNNMSVILLLFVYMVVSRVSYFISAESDPMSSSTYATNTRA